MTATKITISVDETKIHAIKKAAQIESRSFSNYLIHCAFEKATELLLKRDTNGKSQ
jgi:uncharacterized protein (DUF1778 family)